MKKLDKEQEKLDKFCAALEPADQKNYRELLDILQHVVNYTIEIGELNKECFKIFEECSNIIGSQFDEKTGWNKDDIFQNCHLPFKKICLEYDAINADASEQFKEWDATREYCKTIFTIIIKKGKNDKAVKGINLLLEKNKKHVGQMKKYCEKILIMNDKIKEFKKGLDVFKN